ncbi:hypothetical protein TOK_1274 [Pseudonocardia sp. N23]|nr:hypothetical protein TOK_1274 [Pseudonocardia sp. N23]
MCVFLEADDECSAAGVDQRGDVPGQIALRTVSRSVGRDL